MHIIAEAGVNHNGRVELAHRLVDAAHGAGANSVKFQTFRAAKLVTGNARKADYQTRNLGRDGAQAEMLKALELEPQDFRALRDHCVARGIEFLSTPFDTDSATFLVEDLGCGVIKIGSGDMDNLPLLIQVGRLSSRVILSTGMATLGEIETSLAALAFGYVAPRYATPSRAAFAEAYASREGRDVLDRNVVLLQCTTEYPAPVESLNLRAIGTLRAAFGLDVGFSDHSLGHEAAVAALALGACMLEKHMTLDKGMEGPDHAASLEPQEFASLVAAVRKSELALGDGIKRPQAAERGNIAVARKSVVAASDIRAGEILTADNLTLKRADGGRPASAFFDLMGTAASREYAADEVIV